jgi:hypothetical protein
LGLFVAVANSGSTQRVMTSSDGISWTLRDTPADNAWRSVCWATEAPDGGMFLTVAESGTGNRAMTSRDGIKWELLSTPVDNNWTSVCWSPEQRTFAAVGQSGSGNRAFTVKMTPRVDHGFHAVHREGVSGAEQNIRVRSFAPVKPRGVNAKHIVKRDSGASVNYPTRHDLRVPATLAQCYAPVRVYDPRQNPKAEDLRRIRLEWGWGGQCSPRYQTRPPLMKGLHA